MGQDFSRASINRINEFTSVFLSHTDLDSMSSRHQDGTALGMREAQTQQQFPVIAITLLPRPFLLSCTSLLTVAKILFRCSEPQVIHAAQQIQERKGKPSLELSHQTLCRGRRSRLLSFMHRLGWFVTPQCLSVLCRYELLQSCQLQENPALPATDSVHNSIFPAHLLSHRSPSRQLRAVRAVQHMEQPAIPHQARRCTARYIWRVAAKCSAPAVLQVEQSCILPAYTAQKFWNSVTLLQHSTHLHAICTHSTDQNQNTVSWTADLWLLLTEVKELPQKPSQILTENVL